MTGLIPFNHRRNNIATRNLFNMMDDFFNDAWPFNQFLMSDTFKVDVKESDNAYTIEAEMPGVDKKEINLSLRDERLVISIQRNEEIDSDNDNYIHRERRYSSMQRSIFLDGASDEGAEAKLENGILKIVVFKKERTDSSKRIEIK